jgi:hypothetical protein
MQTAAGLGRVSEAYREKRRQAPERVPSGCPPVKELLEEARDAASLRRAADVCWKLAANRDLPGPDRSRFADCAGRAELLAEREREVLQEVYERALEILYRLYVEE